MRRKTGIARLPRPNEGGRIMKTKARDRLTELLTDGIDVHRCAAARALGSMGLPESSAPLVKALLDEDP
ncbi:MAG TPA: HEAT repeat domain-containing protein, partial [Rhodobacteraceae bacterium]|nr:HEAT repeat domain-containing protein [Paracoccaceae bacterium]